MRVFKKSVSILLVLTMVIGLFTIIPFEVGAQETVSYINRYSSWWDPTVITKTETTSYYTLLHERDSNRLGWGKYVVDRNITVNDRLYVGNNDVSIILCDDVTLTCNKGIQVGSKGKLHIYGQTKGNGKLVATFPHCADSAAEKDYAVIGADKGDTGEIYICGGNLVLYGQSGSRGAVIGGGKGGAPEKVYIYSGEVNCDVYGHGACIGGGKGAKAAYDSISIFGGKIYCKSQIRSAAIGSGDGGSGGSINIYGGTVTADARGGGAGIGGGEGGSNGPIYIGGGYITASGTSSKVNGAGVGSGGKANQDSPVRIYGGTVVASGQASAGIGAGNEGKAGEITIGGGTVVAISTAGGAGIGSGKEGGTGGNIVIKDAAVVAGSSNFSDSESLVNRMHNSVMVLRNPPIGNNINVGAAIQTIAWLIDIFDTDYSGAGIGGGHKSGVDSISITNSEVVANSGNYASAIGGGEKHGVGTINIDNSIVTATSGKYGAAIGTGDESPNGCTINITNGSVITANAGTDAAAIGTGNECGGTPTINISDSEIKEAHGGRYGAGIGGGDAVSGGSITISRSVIKDASSETDGTGIGGGESGSGGTIEISGSTVKATGGGYGAGIGGGDSGNGGTIKICSSTVKAYGGTDAAGIGGGDGGNGGHIEIYGRSDVYAEGKEYGAGIGGGEDAGVDYVEITEYSTVEAVAGSVNYGGRAVAIGNGDYNSFWSSRPSCGTFSLDNSTKVDAGSAKSSTAPYYGNSRFNALRENRYARIHPCEHARTEWHDFLNTQHVKYCLDCGARVSGTEEDHVWDSSYRCTICNYSANTATMTFVEKNNQGETTFTIDAPSYSYYPAPECRNVPDGYEFACWYDDEYHNIHRPGDPIQVNVKTLRAVYQQVVAATYVDTDGTEKTVNARRLSNTDLFLADGWYIIDRDLTVRETMYVLGDAKLIVADGKTYNFSSGACYSVDCTNYADSSLTVYGQSAQSGVLNLGSTAAFFFHFTQHGAVVKENSFFKSFKSMAVTGGTLELHHCEVWESAALLGGKVHCGWISSETLTFSWNDINTSFRLDSIIPSQNGESSVVENTILSGWMTALTDGTNIYSGKLTNSQLDAMRGKTLVPYFPQGYEFSHCEWTAYYTNAFMVMKNQDTGETINLKAKVHYQDADNIRTSTATCVFNGQTYTATHTTKLIWNVNIQDNLHGAISVSDSKAKTNDVVLVTFTPDDGYVLKTWTVTPEDASQHIDTEGRAFTMPESDVTVSAEFIPYVAMTEPYTDDNGEYHLGNVTYVMVDGEPYAVKDDGTIGERLESTALSYFDFALFGNYYIIKAYTGPTENLSEIVIPKSFNGHDVDRVYTYDSQLFTPNGKDIKLVLNENIISISSNAFKDMNVTEVTGNTDNLNEIDDLAFASSDDGGDNPLKIDLHTTDSIEVGTDVFLNRSVMIHALHGGAYFDRENYTGGAKSITYVFDDAHTYDDPVWTWSGNCTEASATFTCSDPRCGHIETVEATLSGEISGDKYIVTASVEMNGRTYTDTKELSAENVPSQIEYIDEDGAVKTAWAYPVTGNTTSLSGGWHYVDGEVVIQNNTPIQGNVKIILCDGACLTTQYDNQNLGDDDAAEGTTLSFYRAPGENEGKLSAKNIYAGTVKVIGGRVTAHRSFGGGDVSVKGGSLSAQRIATNADFDLSGGDVRIDGDWFWALNCAGDINISGGSLYVKPSSGGGVTCDGNFTVSGGTVNVDGEISSYSEGTTVRISGGDVTVAGDLIGLNDVISGGNTEIDGELYAYNDITLGWTNYSDSIYAAAYGVADNIFIVEGQTLTDGTDTYSGTYGRDQCNIFAGKTLTPYVAILVDRVEPTIDESDEYHLGTIEHYRLGEKNYAVNADGSVGEELSDLSLSYFEFTDNGSAWQIDRYTGPTDDLTVLEIPKTFNGKKITILGNNSNTQLIDYTNKAKGQYELKLTENIEEIKPYTFYTDWVACVTGDTSNLKTLGDYAFSWANSPGGFTLDIRLDYAGRISTGHGAFNHMNVIAHLKHAAELSTASTWQTSLRYDFTDAHIYDAPSWTWADDHSSATATFTCTDNRCKHQERIEATVTKTEERSKITYTATAALNGETYTDTQIVEKTACAVTIADIEHGSVSVAPNPAYEGEEVTLTVIPDAGYKLSSLTVKTFNNQVVEVIDGKFMMPGYDVTVTAAFEQNVYDIAYAETDGGWVRGALSANNGEEITLSVIPAEGYELDTLTVTGADDHEVEVLDNTFTMPDSSVTVAATFKKRDLSIRYVVADGRGTITGATTAQFNDEVPLTITPAEGYALLNLYAELDNEWDESANIIDGVLIMPDCDAIVYAEFAPVTPAKEPWIDENGEYHLGNLEYCDSDGFYFEVKDGKVGAPIDSVDVSYFDFTDNGSSWQINYYNGPTENLTELVIPKTYQGKPITVLGTSHKTAFIASSDPKPRFVLTLNENIREIKGYAFYTMWVTKVQGDTSNLSKLGNYAFSWANSPGGYTLDIKLDYSGVITAGYEMFNHMNVAARVKHATKFNSNRLGEQSITYIFTDAHTYGVPIWTWSDDLTFATATFTCTDSRCRHQETVDATITSETKDGIITYTATAEIEGETYTDKKEAFADGIGARLAGHSISLEGDIAVNFYMELSPEVASHDGAYMQFTVPNTSKEYQDQKIYVKDLTPVESGGKTYYVFKCKIAAKDMRSEISAQLIDGDKASTVYKYSVKEYADYLIEHQDENQTFKEAVPLIEAMLQYGTYANNYFSDADALEELVVDIPEKAFTEATLPEGVTFDGATLSLKSQTTLSLYFVSEQEITLSIDGVDCETAHNGNEYVIRIRNIPAAELNKDFTVTVNGAGSFTYSPMTYCYKAANSQTADVKLKNVVKALYKYWLEADEYFNQGGN